MAGLLSPKSGGRGVADMASSNGSHLMSPYHRTLALDEYHSQSMNTRTRTL